jgi:hypothetical protein
MIRRWEDTNDKNFGVTGPSFDAPPAERNGEALSMFLILCAHLVSLEIGAIRANMGIFCGAPPAFLTRFRGSRGPTYIARGVLCKVRNERSAQYGVEVACFHDHCAASLITPCSTSLPKEDGT